jgi:uncharacterized repeat protein (TIGR03803 family)
VKRCVRGCGSGPSPASRPACDLLFVELASTPRHRSKVELKWECDRSGESVRNLVQGSDGWFYGTTIDGGTLRQGTVFRVAVDGTFEVLHSFLFGNKDGELPYASLVQAGDGAFYGTTTYGGASNEGTVFRSQATERTRGFTPFPRLSVTAHIPGMRS